jgi:hypothetical protein
MGSRRSSIRTVRRLSELTDKQLADVIERLMNLRSQYSAITDRLLTQLVRLSS